VLKELRAAGRLSADNTVLVRLKAQTHTDTKRLREKYTVERCSDTAQFIRETRRTCEAKQEELSVTVQSRVLGRQHTCVVDSSITIGEFIRFAPGAIAIRIICVCCRHACVNLGVDPDTHEGVTRNVLVELNDETLGWPPSSSLRDVGLLEGAIVKLEPLASLDDESKV
jgi:hypothetical protein